MSLPISTRPRYEVCTAESCGRYVLYKDYIYVLVEAGVPLDSLLKDLFLDSDECCVQDIITGAPAALPEYVARLNLLKDIRLQSPPDWYKVDPNSDARVQYHLNAARLVDTDIFLGAELYYYLVERGERPETALEHLGITNPVDIDAIVSVTDRPSNEFECEHCGEYLPHAKFLAYLTQSRTSQAFVPRPDIPVNICCRESIIHLQLTEEEKAEAAELARELEVRSGGLPVDLETHDSCMSCGLEGVRQYPHYEWLVHHGIPPAIALDYFGLYRLCCRQIMMNPRIVPRVSKAVRERQLHQESEIPLEPTIDFDYEANLLPVVRGSV